MIRTHNSADPFVLRLNHLDWVEEAPVRGFRTFLDRHLSSLRAHPRLALGLALAAFAAVFLTAGVHPAHDAAMIAAPASIAVRSDDLDFNHAPDAQVMLDRIEAAAEKACGGTPDYRQHRQLEVFDLCRRATIKQAVDQLDKPILIQLAETQPMPMHLVIR